MRVWNLGVLEYTWCDMVAVFGGSEAVQIPPK